MSKFIPLSSLAEVNPRTARPTDKTMEVSFIPMSDVSESGQWTEHKIRKLSEVSQGFTAFQDNDVLFAKITPCMENGKGALVHNLRNRVGFGSTEFHVLRAKPGHADPGYIFHWLNYFDTREKAKAFFTGSAGQQRVAASFFDFLLVPDITVDDQRGIAEVLSAMDEQIEATETLVAKQRHQLVGLAQALLPEGFDVEFPPTSQLTSALLCIEAGKSFMCSDTPAAQGDWGVLKVSAVRPDGFDSVENKSVTNPKLVNPQYEVRNGDLLITRANTPELVAAACLVNATQEKLLLCDKTLRLVPKPGVNPAYLWLWLQTPVVRRHIDAHATGTSAGMKNISQKAINSIPLYLPSFEEQQAKVEPLLSLSQLIRECSQEADKLRLQKQGLMHDLLTGKTRVVQ